MSLFELWEEQKVEVKTAFNSKAKKDMLKELDLVKQNVLKAYGHKMGEYLCIRKEHELICYINKCIKAGIVAIDAETTGTDAISDDLVGIVLYYPSGRGAYVPIAHIDPFTGEVLKNQLSFEFVSQQLKRLIDANIFTEFFNFSFDNHIIRRFLGIEFYCSWDVYISARMYNTEEKRNQLKVLWNKYYAVKNREKKDIALTYVQLFGSLNFAYVPIEYATLYAAADGQYTDNMREFYQSEFEKEGMERVYQAFLELEMPIANITYEMEREGLTFDISLAEQAHKEYSNKIVELEAKFQELLSPYKEQLDSYRKKPIEKINGKIVQIDDPINISSPNQLYVLLYNILGYDGDSRNKSTDKAALKKIGGEICKTILEWRALSKLLTTYVEALPQRITKEKKIHASFNSYGADCVIGDTLIPTEKGFYRISEFASDNMLDNVFYPMKIKIINKNKNLEKTSALIKFSNIETKKIVTKYNIVLEGTYNHPILISTNGNIEFKKLEELKVNDFIVIPTNYKIPEPEYKKLNYFEVSVTKESICKNITIPEIIDENIGLLLGIYHADGVIHSSNGSYSIVICNRNKDVINTVDSLSQQLFSIKTHNHMGANKKSDISTSITSIRLSGFNHLFSRGARNKKIPDFIYKSPTSVIKSYIKGMTLDSHVSYRTPTTMRISLNAANEVDARFIQTFLFSLGIVSSILQYKGTYKKNNRDYNYFRICITTDYCRRFADLIGFVEQYKQSICESFMDKLPNTEYILAPIKSIQNSKSDVYDFTVPTTHSFISNGIISHNTGRFVCAKPNLLNLPRDDKYIRRMFSAPDGYCLVGMDFSLIGG